MQGKTQSIILGAVVTALIGVILAYVAQANQYLGMLACCVPGVLGALLAVWHYTDLAGVTMSSGEGAKLGAVTGAIGSILSSLLSLALQGLGILRGPAEQIEFQRQQLETQGLSPEQIDQAMSMAEKFTSPTFLLLFAVVGVLIGALVGAVGGSIGASLFKKGEAATPQP